MFVALMAVYEVFYSELSRAQISNAGGGPK